MNVQVFKVPLFILLSLMLTPQQSRADRWRDHGSEAEVSTLFRSLLEEAELDPKVIEVGAYPLFGPQFSEGAVLPLLSSPCPLLLSCDELIRRFRVELLSRGYQLVYSDQRPRSGGPRHYAVSMGRTPVLAIRVYESSTLLSAVLHLNPASVQREAEIENLPSHLTLSIDQELMQQLPDLPLWLAHREREFLIRIDEVLIRRALIDPDQGTRVIASQQRRSQMRSALKALISLAPDALGFFLDQRALEAMDRSLIDELVEFSADKHRVIVTPKVMSPVLNAVALSKGVRAFELTRTIDLGRVGDDNMLQQGLSAVEAALVLEGEAALSLNFISPTQRDTFKRWLSGLAERKVNLLRVSERAR